jgi:phage shock protein B
MAMGDFIGLMTGFFAVTMPVWIIWIIFHYKSINKSREGMSQDEARQLEELLEIADNMADRIKTLESILDDETPEWRDRVREQQGEE